MTIKVRALAGAALSVLTVSMALFAQPMAKAVAVVLHSPQDSYKAGQPIQLTLVTSNKSDKEVSITVSPGLEDATYNCEALVKRAGSNPSDEPLEPAERPSKRHTRSAFGYTLAPKASLSMRYDLTRKYILDEPGTYSVKLRCSYFDGVSSIPVFSNPISITVTQ